MPTASSVRAPQSATVTTNLPIAPRAAILAIALPPSAKAKVSVTRGAILPSFHSRNSRSILQAVRLRVARREGAPEHAADIARLQQSEIQRQARNARRKADDEIAPFPGDGSQRRLGIITADRIIDDVRTALAERGLELVGERLRLILVERRARIDECIVSARVPGGGGLFLRGNSGDDARAERLAEFDRGQPDAARRTENEQRLPFGEMPAVEQRVDRRAVGQQQRCALGEAAVPRADGTGWRREVRSSRPVRRSRLSR